MTPHPSGIETDGPPPAAQAAGFRLYPGAISPDLQAELVATVLSLAEQAPFYTPVTPGGQPMSVQMTNFGPVGWVTDRTGYRYQSHHPQTGRPWPAAPPILSRLWGEFCAGHPVFDACLVNFYGKLSKMGTHQDHDETDLSVPVLSISLGDTAVFRLGGRTRRDPTRSVRLASGDVCVLAGEARLAFHGVDRIIPGSSRLVPGGGRINLTLRRAGPVLG